jgi:hypothetical protein
MHDGGNCGSGIKESYLPFHELRMILTLLPSIIYLQICHTQGKMFYTEIPNVWLRFYKIIKIRITLSLL